MWTWTNCWVMGCTLLSGCIHTCDFFNYCVNHKVQQWVVHPFLCDFQCYFCLNNEGTEVQHKAGVNIRNHSCNSLDSHNSWENCRCECTFRLLQIETGYFLWMIQGVVTFIYRRQFITFCISSEKKNLLQTWNCWSVTASAFRTRITMTTTVVVKL